MITHPPSNHIILYKTPTHDALTVRLDTEHDTVFLTQQQMAVLFGRDVRTINEHLISIFKTGELRPKSVIRKFRIAAKDGKVYETQCYNLDAILSVGYRVNSKEGTRFRMWANMILKKYLIEGAALNRKRLIERGTKELERTLTLVRGAIDRRELTGDEAKGLLKVITEYTQTWVTLRQYDDRSLPSSPKTSRRLKDLTEEEAERAIGTLKVTLQKKDEASELFGRATGAGIRSILRNLHQTFDGKPLYMSIAERAAHLLYFVIKDHPFVDGNKRIACLLLLMFLRKHGKLTDRRGERAIDDTGLTALALLIAESKPAEKETMIRLIQTLL